MKTKTFNYIISLIRNNMNEEAPTVSASNGQISGVSSGNTPPTIDDLPPVDLRKKMYKNLPNHYKDLFRRRVNGIQPKSKS